MAIVMLAILAVPTIILAMWLGTWALVGLTKLEDWIKGKRK